MVKNKPNPETPAWEAVTKTDSASEILDDTRHAMAELSDNVSVTAGNVPTPVPSGVTGTWFPALVVLPGQRHQLPSKVRVYATPEGLYIYDRVPQDQAQTQRPDPLWYAPITYPETPRPPANYSAGAANGFGIVTTKGTVMVTVPKGCPVCGVRAMAVWQPVWAHTLVAAEWKEA
jgi:hypothetical protein